MFSRLGWQPAVIAFFAGGMAALVFAIIQAVVYRDNSLPFGPGLAAGTVATMLCWRWIGPRAQLLMFNESLLLFLIVAGLVLMFVAANAFRFARGPQSEPEA